MFLQVFDCSIASYADDKTAYTSDNYLDTIFKLQNSSNTLPQWFEDNFMEANPHKCRLLVTNNDLVSIKLKGFHIKNSSGEEKLLGKKFSTQLSFESHVSSLYEKTSQKLHPLERVVNYVDFDKRKYLMNAFITSNSANVC